MPAATEALTLNQATLSLIIGVASGAFTGAGVYFGLVYRIKRLEECHDEMEARMSKSDERFEGFKAQREALTEQWREDTRKRDVKDARVEMKMERFEEMLVAIADHLRVPL